jgi:DNA polymerase elongation subunit (family B)
VIYELDIVKILFLDIETVPQVSDFSKLDNTKQKLWGKKAKLIVNSDVEPADVYSRAGIYAEFGKIVCISTGFITIEDGERKLRLKSFFDDDEKKLLKDFNELLNSHFNSDDYYLCGHNGKEFDYPYIARRMLVNGIKLPKLLDIAGKKPWEVKHLDTLELWKFGDYKHYTSLELLTNIFNIPTPKDDIDGSQVNEVYYKENDLKRIAIYCEKDVIATASLFLRYRGDDLISEENIISVSKF